MGICRVDKIILKEYKDRSWLIAEVWKNNEKIADINKFYEVTEFWILIYDTNGGQGIGYSKGNLIQKIYIGNCEFEKQNSV